jgi:hypothetical protein
MNSVVDGEGKIDVIAPESSAGDYVEMEALMDLIIGLSACPCEESECNGSHCTPVQLDVESPSV